MIGLPSEIIVQILEHADHRSARTLSLACSRFRRIVVQFRRKMKKAGRVDIVITFGTNGIGFQCKSIEQRFPPFVNLNVDELLTALTTAEVHFEIDSLEVQGVISDAALKVIFQCMRHHSNIELKIFNSTINFTNMKMWESFLSMVQPTSLTLSLTDVHSPNLFTEQTHRDAMAKLHALRIGPDVSFIQPHGAVEFSSLLQLRANRINIVSFPKFAADPICAKLECWLRGEEDLEHLYIDYDRTAHLRLCEFLKQIPGDNSDFRVGKERKIINANGQVVLVTLSKTHLFIHSV